MRQAARICAIVAGAVMFFLTACSASELPDSQPVQPEAPVEQAGSTEPTVDQPAQFKPEIGIIDSADDRALFNLILESFDSMLFYESALSFGWDVALGEIQGKKYATEDRELNIGRGIVVGNYRRYFFEYSTFAELSVRIREELSLALTDVVALEYFVDDESNAYIFVPKLISQSFAFGEGMEASNVIPVELWGDGWVKINLKSELLSELDNLSFLAIDGSAFFDFLQSNDASEALLGARYEGTSLIDEIEHEHYSLLFDYSSLIEIDRYISLFNAFNDDLGISDEDVSSTVGDAPVSIDVHLSSEGFVRRVETTLNLSQELFDVFDISGELAEDEPTETKFVLETRLDFTKVNEYTEDGSEPAVVRQFTDGVPSFEPDADNVVELSEVLG